MSSLLHGLAALAGATLLAPMVALAGPTLVYSNNFDTAATVAGGVTASGLNNGVIGAALGSYDGSGGKSWSGNHFANHSTGNPATTSTLTLSNLGEHNFVSIDMMLGFLNSWDSSNGAMSPDFLDIFIDGVQVAQLTTANASGNVAGFGGGTQLVNNGQIDVVGGWSDDLVDMGTASFLSFAHTGSSLTLGMRASGAGWQGGNDEFWGVDSLSVSITSVPEPATAALLAVAGIAAFGLRRRRTG